MHNTLNDITLEMRLDAIETRGDDWGDQRVRHIDLPAGTDFTPLLAGLPGDMCQCPHWGYVLEGSMTLRYADGHEETTAAGEAYYWPAGHTGWTTTGAKFIEFSPTPEIAVVLDHIAAKLAATS